MKTEGAIKNGQSRDTCNIGHTGHRVKTNKTKYNTTYKTFKKWATQTAQKWYVKWYGQASAFHNWKTQLVFSYISYQWQHNQHNNVSIKL